MTPKDMFQFKEYGNGTMYSNYIAAVKRGGSVKANVITPSNAYMPNMTPNLGGGTTNPPPTTTPVYGGGTSGGGSYTPIPPSSGGTTQPYPSNGSGGIGNVGGGGSYGGAPSTAVEPQTAAEPQTAGGGGGEIKKKKLPNWLWLLVIVGGGYAIYTLSKGGK